MREGDTSLGGAQRDLPKTNSELIGRAQDSSQGTRRAGLEELFRKYWKPIYTTIRITWAKSNEDAKDLTQAFFLWLMESGAVDRYEAERGGFRPFLKSLLRHFTYRRDEALGRLKRGGGVRLLDLEVASLSLESPPPPSDSERVFDRAWMKEVFARALHRVRERLIAGGQEIRFRVFEEYDLCPPEQRPTYAAEAERRGITESDVRNHLFATRQDIKTEVRRLLAEMTRSDEELEQEWNLLFRS